MMQGKMFSDLLFQKALDFVFRGPKNKNNFATRVVITNMNSKLK